MLALMPVLALALLPAACAEGGSGDPVAWWHHLEGGAIARQRPAPPNADAPYPNLSTVPPRPQTLGAAERGRIASTLVKDRANAEYAAATVPIVPPGAVKATAAPAANPDAPNAVMDAASPPPAAPPAAPPVTAPKAPAVASNPAAAGPMPGIPLAPPPPPVLPGVAGFTRPSPAPVAPPPAPARPVFAPGQPVPVAFPSGSAALPPGIEAALARLAATRGAADMRVAGFGDATGNDPAAQAAALPLAFARADSITNALARAGVPLAAIRLSAEAQGHGGLAAVVN